MVGASTPAQYVLISSTGTAPLQVSGVTVGGANPGDFHVIDQIGTCVEGTSMASTPRCILRISFAPTAAGSRTATLSIADNAAGSPQQVTLNGTAIPAEELTMSTTALSFAPTTVGVTTAAQYIVLKSTGLAPVIVSNTVLAGADAGDFDLSNQAGTCITGMTLEPGAAGCTLRLQFHPKATGSRSATVVINDSTTATPHLVTLSGTGK
jgi:hypothetical protein